MCRSTSPKYTFYKFLYIFSLFIVFLILNKKCILEWKTCRIYTFCRFLVTLELQTQSPQIEQERAQLRLSSFSEDLSPETSFALIPYLPDRAKFNFAHKNFYENSPNFTLHPLWILAKILEKSVYFYLVDFS